MTPKSQSAIETIKLKRARDRIVNASMLVIAAAVAAVLYLQAGLTIAPAAGSGFAVFIVMMAIQIMSRRTERILELEREVGRLEGEMFRATSGIDQNRGLRRPPPRRPEFSDVRPPELRGAEAARADDARRPQFPPLQARPETRMPDERPSGSTTVPDQHSQELRVQELRVQELRVQELRVNEQRPADGASSFDPAIRPELRPELKPELKPELRPELRDGALAGLSAAAKAGRVARYVTKRDDKPAAASGASAKPEDQPSSERGVQMAAERGVQMAAERGVQMAAERGVQMAAERGVQMAAERGAPMAAERGAPMAAAAPPPLLPLGQESHNSAPVQEPQYNSAISDDLALRSAPWSDVTGRSDLVSDFWDPSKADGANEEQRSATGTIRDADVAYVGDMIRQLAAEVNASESLAMAANASQQQAQKDRAYAANALNASIGALKGTADTMRRGRTNDHQQPDSQDEQFQARARENLMPGFADSLIPPSAQPIAVASWTPRLASAVASAPTPSPALPPSLSKATAAPAAASSNPSVNAAAVSEAILAGRMDVFLSPILGLHDKRTHHFEVSVRLRSVTGALLADPTDMLELTGTGLLGLFDASRLARTAHLASRLNERGKIGSVFSRVSGDSIGGETFMTAVTDTRQGRPDVLRQLVLTFSQTDVRGFGTRTWDALAGMSEAGFRFALQDVRDFDVDFGALRACGFKFVKLASNVFLEGLPASQGYLTSAEVCRHLAGEGLTLIVDGINDEATFARVFGFGALFGQGQLFGGERPIKANAVAGGNQHAAA